MDSIAQTNKNSFQSLEEKIQTFFNDNFKSILSIGSSLNSIKENFISEKGSTKGNKAFKRQLSEQKSVKFAKFALDTFNWYSNLEENQQNRVLDEARLLDLQALEQLIKLPSKFLDGFLSKITQAVSHITSKVIKTFISTETKIQLGLPLKEKHWVIVEKQFDLDSQSVQFLKSEFNSDSTTTELAQKLELFDPAIAKKVFLKPRTPKSTKSEHQQMQPTQIQQIVYQTVQERLQPLVEENKLVKEQNQLLQEQLHQLRSSYEVLENLLRQQQQDPNTPKPPKDFLTPNNTKESTKTKFTNIPFSSKPKTSSTKVKKGFGKGSR